MTRLGCLFGILCAACGTTVQPADAGSLPDGVVADSATAADVQIVEPTSLVHVRRYVQTVPTQERVEVVAFLAQPEAVVPGAIDRGVGDCFHRRQAPSSTSRYHTDGVANWGYRDVRRTLTQPFPAWPLADVTSEARPDTGDVVNVSLRGSSFPDFSLSAAMPSELTVTSHTAGSTIAYPGRGEPLVVEWAVPTAPANVRIGINWNDSDSLFCIVPATRGRFVMDEPLLEMFRDATTAQLVVSHAEVQRVIVGNRSLRFIVERRGVLVPFAR